MKRTAPHIDLGLLIAFGIYIILMGINRPLPANTKVENLTVQEDIINFTDYYIAQYKQKELNEEQVKEHIMKIEDEYVRTSYQNKLDQAVEHREQLVKEESNVFILMTIVLVITAIGFVIIQIRIL